MGRRGVGSCCHATAILEVCPSNQGTLLYHKDKFIGKRIKLELFFFFTLWKLILKAREGNMY